MLFLPSEQERFRIEEKQQKQEYYRKCRSGEINGKYTAVITDGSFTPVRVPEIGKKYHLSWAYKGAVFVLEKVDQDGIHGYVNNPKHKLEQLRKIKLADLYELRKS